MALSNLAARGGRLVVAGGGLTGLTQLLAEDITLWSDGGGKTAAAVRPLRGPLSVARFLLGLASKSPPETSVEVVTANAAPGILIRVAGRPFSLFGLELADDRVQAIRVVVNPDKLRHPDAAARRARSRHSLSKNPHLAGRMGRTRRAATPHGVDNPVPVRSSVHKE